MLSFSWVVRDLPAPASSFFISAVRFVLACTGMYGYYSGLPYIYLLYLVVHLYIYITLGVCVNMCLVCCLVLFCWAGATPGRSDGRNRDRGRRGGWGGEWMKRGGGKTIEKSTKTERVPVHFSGDLRCCRQSSAAHLDHTPVENPSV